MKIEHYISQLLYRYQCVTVPGFGAFLTEIQSAQLQESSHSFYPPKKIVSFNAYVKNNDGLLANHIAQSEKMSYEVVVSLIDFQVVSWKNKLQKKETISLKNIGEFHLNSDNGLVFSPSEQTNYLTTSFGLTSYNSPAIKREVYKQEVEVLEEKAPIAFTPETRTGPNYLKYAAIFLLTSSFLTTSGYFGKNYYDQKVEQETLAIQTRVQKQVNQKIQEATFFIENPLPSVTLNVGEEKMPYHIVAGVFSRKENAEKVYTELIKLGYKAKQLKKNKHGLYPVLYGSFSSLAIAEKETERIKKSHNPEAWLLVQEL